LANTELGEKRTCPECGSKFYDLGKRPAVCPKCRASFDPASDVAKPKRTREKAKPAPVVADEEEEEEVEDDEAEEAAESDDEEEEIEAEETVEVDLVDEDEVVEPEEEAEPAARVPASKKYVAPGAPEEDDEEVEIEDEDDGLTVIDEDEEFADDIPLEGGADEEEL